MQMKLAVIGVGLALCWFGFKEHRLASGASAEPQDITCRELGTNGPGGNAHVRMTDHLLVHEAFVVSSRNAQSDQWEKSWVPAVPIDSDFAKRVAAASDDEEIPPPDTFSVLVYNSTGGNDSLLQSMMASGYYLEPVQGLVINEVEDLDADEARILKQSYPSFDPERVWIIARYRKPSTGGKPLFMMIGGLGLIIAGGFWMWSSYQSQQRAAQAHANRGRRRMARRQEQFDQQGPDERPPSGAVPRRRPRR